MCSPDLCPCDNNVFTSWSRLLNKTNYTKTPYFRKLAKEMTATENTTWKSYETITFTANTMIPLSFNNITEWNKAAKKKYEDNLKAKYGLTVTGKLYSDYYSCFTDIVNNTNFKWSTARF